MTDGEKTCSKCRETKPLYEFHKKLDGRDTRCKDCKKEYQQQWYQRNREAVIEASAEWQKANKDRVNAKNRTWRKKNPGKQEAASAAWRAANPERVRIRRANWVAANPELVRAAARRGVAARRAKLLNATIVEFTPDQLAQRWAYYGDKCYLCGEEATATDHVKPLTKGGAHMLCNLRPICKSCNSRKNDQWPYAPVFERVAA